ncbi:fumarylacetoacetate hydrolase family protein [Massilia forsythiae]|uniref:Fumarylacetoacetate hydrolase family protein n=1 Tax=Massilia forsythiae TaxID=2728020 RepID=A0A7Z2VYZ2_9BURK|nr:fumarylacetoacetate hydrolase family protein [Massilia forsythiae]QJE01967.1 fumarylacetoacetate hydrolase family protein [Massilia forsythiae]
MDNHRRNLLKASASAAVGSLLAGAGSAQAQAREQEHSPGGINGAQVKSVPPLAARVGLRLATCVPGADGAQAVMVVLDDGRMIDLQAEAARQKTKLGFDAGSMLELIKSGDAGLEQVRTLAARALRDKAPLLPLAQARLLSPIPRPDRNIYCVGWNYLDHFEEGKNARADKRTETLPDHPVFFTKATHTMNGPFDPIPQDAANSTQTDWEAELAVIVGRRGRNIAEDQAMDYVFGYAVYNDTTERDIQQKRHGGQWFKGKSLDGHGPMGPWIVTAAGVRLDDMRIVCRVNGVEKQNAGYKQMYFKIPRIIAELSRGMTLEPGDIIATGTPSGVGFARKPPEFMKHGDVMETEITGIGVIRNTIRAEG